MNYSRDASLKYPRKSMVNIRRLMCMIAMLWANEIMLGNYTFDEVPRRLKEKVAKILIDSGCEDLITDEAYKPQSTDTE